MQRAVAACERLGPEAVLLLVGSRAAGFAGPGADLDLWILGDAARLSRDEQAAHARRGELFVDRGDLRAHYSFFDARTIAARVDGWQDETMWILSTSHVVHGRAATAAPLVERSRTYPREVAERKLEWLVGSCRSLGSAFPKSGEGRAAGGALVFGRLLESLCKLCFVADRHPFPYTKWLARAARETRVGARVWPHVESALAALESSPLLPEGVRAPDWPPRRELMGGFRAALDALPALGWGATWIEDPWQAAGAYLSRPVP